MWQLAVIFLFMGFSIYAEEEGAKSTKAVSPAAQAAPEVKKAAAVSPAAQTVPEVKKAAAVSPAAQAAPEVNSPAAQAAPEVKKTEAVNPAKESKIIEEDSKALHKTKESHKDYCHFSKCKFTKSGFFSVHFTNSFNIPQRFRWTGPGLRLGYGGKLFRDSDFELNVNIFSPFTPSFGLKYEQGFLKNQRWFPGFDASLLFGNIQERYEGEDSFAVGLEGGVFASTFISKYYSVTARTGLSYTVPVSGNIFEEDPNFYISFGVKKFLR